MQRIEGSFPALPVLSVLVSKSRLLDLEIWSRTHVVAVQHLLESTGSLFHSLCAMGIPSHQIHVLGKHYSTNTEVSAKLRAMGIQVYEASVKHRSGCFSSAFMEDAASMWRRVLTSFEKSLPRLIIVLDDGGRCLQNLPASLYNRCAVIGIEQTTSGVRTSNCTQVIQVATSAAKKLLEPPLIAEATFSKISPSIRTLKTGSRCGVIGVGNIGKAIASGLNTMGHVVFATDSDASKYQSVPYANWRANALAVLRDADYIYGCTGNDVFSNVSDLSAVQGQKTLLSVSSEDIEFRALLQRRCLKNSVDPRADVLIDLPKGTLRIVKGGFPVNFDGTPISVPSTSIQLTRGLLFGAVIQAASMQHASAEKGRKSMVMLDPAIQNFVVSEWLRSASLEQRPPQGMTDCFRDLDWISSNSQGQHLLLPFLSQAYSTTS